MQPCKQCEYYIYSKPNLGITLTSWGLTADLLCNSSHEGEGQNILKQNYGTHTSDWHIEYHCINSIGFAIFIQFYRQYRWIIRLFNIYQTRLSTSNVLTIASLRTHFVKLVYIPLHGRRETNGRNCDSTSYLTASRMYMHISLKY